MTLNYTNRLGLNKPDQDEFQLVDVLNQNADILDTYVGVKMVTANVIPPVNQMYDGLIVNERDTGKTWIASSNGTGGFDRAWIRYPWFCWATTQTYTAANALLQALTMTWYAGTNSTAVDVPAGRVKIPISGVYSVQMNAYFGANSVSGNGHRSIVLYRNNLRQSYTGQYNPIDVNNSAQQYQYNYMNMNLNAGDLLNMGLYQDSAAVMPGTYGHMCVTLVSVTGKNNN